MLREHNKYHGYTVRGTPNCPLMVGIRGRFLLGRLGIFSGAFAVSFRVPGIHGVPQRTAGTGWKLLKSF